MIGVWKGWAITVLVALLSAIAVARAVSGDLDVPGIACGWAVAAASSAAALFLNRQSIGPDLTRFLRYGLLGNGLRFLVVLALLVGFPIVGGGGYVSFATALVISYLVLTAHEIWTLHVAGLTATGPGNRCQSGRDGRGQRNDGHE
jgi:hypothetical protein